MKKKGLFITMLLIFSIKNYAQQYFTPVITLQPSAITQTICDGGQVLSVDASDGALNRFEYQWFRNTSPSYAGAICINGATNKDYTVPTDSLKEGPNYYYCLATPVAFPQWKLMLKNLDVVQYRNGDPIPYVSDATVWSQLTTGAYCYYNNDPSSKSSYGLLYNWYAVNDPRGLAPIGWHVPTDQEWQSITLKSAYSIFAGYRFANSGKTVKPYSKCYHGYWWSSSENSNDNAWFRMMYDGDENNVLRLLDSKKTGMAVRCIRDNFIQGNTTTNAITITTSALDSITKTTAIARNTIETSSSAPISESGICWSTSQNPTTGLSTKTVDIPSGGNFFSRITGLIPNTTYYVRAYAKSSVGVGYGNQMSFTTSPHNVTSGSDVTDISGNTYHSISICGRSWTTKNLNVSKYNNGDPIPQITDTLQWPFITTGAWCWYKNDSATYAATYGKLYNWYAVNDSRGIAPAGWHVPTETDWNNMLYCLDSTTNLSCLDCASNTSLGGQMQEKGSVNWQSPNNIGSNSFGFNATPAGSITPQGVFSGMKNTCFWWSATSTGTSNEAKIIMLNLNDPSIYKVKNQKNNGFSIRCIKNSN
jgi:uncharacterized protein (TIGR02145 family)